MWLNVPFLLFGLPSFSSSVDLQNILGEFNKEQEEFIKSQQSIQSGNLPWAGHQNEEKVKEEILGLSSVSDKGNFT